MPSVSSPALLEAKAEIVGSPKPISYPKFKSVMRDYYGLPPSAEWMSRLWTAYKANASRDYPALRDLAQHGVL